MTSFISYIIEPGEIYRYLLGYFYSGPETIMIQETDVNGEQIEEEVLNPDAVLETYLLQLLMTVPEDTEYQFTLKLEFLREGEVLEHLTEHFVYGTNRIEILFDRDTFKEFIKGKIDEMRHDL